MVERNLRKTRTGLVTSNKMDKTITVAVERKGKTPDLWKIRKRRLRSSMLMMKRMNVPSVIR